MASSIAGISLFNSGPHRFTLRAVGRLWLPPLVIDELQDATEVIARPIELRITQTGRLIADDDEALWTLVEAIRQRAEAALKGTLIDHAGTEWPNMTFLRFTPADRIDRARKVSLHYDADYIRLVNDAPIPP